MAKITQGLTFGSLPTWAKGVVAIVGLVAIGGAGFLIYRTIKKTIESSKEKKENKEFQNQTDDVLKDLANQNITPTISDADATSLCNQIQVGLSDCEAWTTERDIVDAIVNLVKNQADWVKLQNVYGVRITPDCGTGETKQDLKGILTSDLDTGESGWGWNDDYIAILKQKLQAKGITW
jgi:hypothetical protein